LVNVKEKQAPYLHPQTPGRSESVTDYLNILRSNGTIRSSCKKRST
jgi:hypothetical protein